MAILVRIAVDAVAVAGPITLGVLGAVWRKQVADMASLIWTKEATFFVAIAAATLAANLYNVAARRVSEHGTRASIRLERRVRALGETLPLDSCAPDAAIRMILQSIAQAAWEFDGRPTATDYGANVMIFSEDEPPAVLFRDKGVPSCGFLNLKRELSTTLSGTAAAPDPSLLEFGIPVPADSARCLPGASLAFQEHSIDFYGDTRKLAAWCRAKKVFSETLSQEIHQYFSSDGKHIRSMLSVAMPHRSPTKPFAVLNLHRYRRNMFAGGRRVAEFVELAEPLFFLLEHRLVLGLDHATDLRGAHDEQDQDASRRKLV